ncbi:MAG: FecR domain-containing protein, partial [Nitrospinota bacterium]|nr:FecR domain-containing protein [Nitrospinota bacterium]
FQEGDTIKTGANGTLEIKYDTGNLTRFDKNTTMEIRSLRRDNKGSTFSVFGLILGRIKSSVHKLATGDSKFEIHTKSAIAGVAGTPPFIVQVIDGQTLVDLLGNPGDPGSVYVQGMDPNKTIVYLFAGFRTIVMFGLPPQDPFSIGADRLNMLRGLLQFLQQQGYLDSGQTTGNLIVVEFIAGKISVYIAPNPTNSGYTPMINASTFIKSGGPGAGEGEGEADNPPPFATGKVNLNFE